MQIKPGQLWRWEFQVNDGWWMFSTVTSSARENFLDYTQEQVMIKRGDTFVVIVPDDPGPAMVPGSNIPMLDEGGLMTSPAQPPKRWHVVMLHGKLVWMDHEDFNQAQLVTDA